MMHAALTVHLVLFQTIISSQLSEKINSRALRRFCCNQQDFLSRNEYRYGPPSPLPFHYRKIIFKKSRLSKTRSTISRPSLKASSSFGSKVMQLASLPEE